MRTLLCVILSLAATAARADETPEIDFGVGGLAMELPDYRGSDHYSTRVLPFPYAIVRTERVQVTREGMRAKLFALDRLSASFSGAITLTGKRDSPERAGMPALSPTVEIGPSLDLRLSDPDASTHLRLRLPLRAAVAVADFEFHGIGFVAAPHLLVDHSETHGRLEWSHLATLGPIWATRPYHQYFYGVAPRYATPIRPAYDAPAGYSGARLTASSAVRRGRWRLGLFGSLDWLDGAAFRGSPLVRAKLSGTAGIFVTYRLYRSGPQPPETETP